MEQSRGHRHIELSSRSALSGRRDCLRGLPLVCCLLSVVLFCVSGCESLTRDLQFDNFRTGIFPMDMELTLGAGKNDAMELMKARTYEGVVERGDVKVHYPAGMSGAASVAANAFVEAEAEIRARTGITWAFKPDIYLVPTSNLAGGFRLRLRLHKNRELKLPLLLDALNSTLYYDDWSKGIAHELTESSMLNSISRRQIVLGDYGWQGNDIVNRTRWFRDGVSEYAGEILNEKLFGERYQPPSWIYKALQQVREDVLDWDNCTQKPNDSAYYAASEGLVCELINRAGPDAIARITQAAFEEKRVDGDTLRRAVKKATGLDLKEFLRDYRMTWLGADFTDSARMLDAQSVVRPGNVVRVMKVYQGTPAEKWKLKPGDTVLGVDGHAVVSSAWLVHYLAARRPHERITVDLLIGGKPVSYRMVTAARYVSP